MDNGLFAVIGLVVGIVLSKFLVNWWFEINFNTKMMKMQNELLIELCRASGVAPEKITQIIRTFNGGTKQEEPKPSKSSPDL